MLAGWALLGLLAWTHMDRLQLIRLRGSRFCCNSSRRIVRIKIMQDRTHSSHYKYLHYNGAVWFWIPLKASAPSCYKQCLWAISESKLYEDQLIFDRDIFYEYAQSLNLLGKIVFYNKLILLAKTTLIQLLNFLLNFWFDLIDWCTLWMK